MKRKKMIEKLLSVFFGLSTGSLWSNDRSNRLTFGGKSMLGSLLIGLFTCIPSLIVGTSVALCDDKSDED